MDRREFLAGAGVVSGASLLVSSVAASAQTVTPAVASRGAMQELLRTIDQLQGEFLAGKYRIVTPGDVAEGQRLVLHILNSGLNFWLEANPARPMFTPYVAPARKLLGDNPDALYYFAPISDAHRYRIRGNLAGATFTSFTVEGGSGDGNAAARSTAALDDNDLQVDAEGNYEITVSSGKPASGNWLPLEQGAGQITTRHYFESRNCIVNQTAFQVPITIETLDPPPLAPAPDDAEIARRIGNVSRYVRAMMTMTLASAASAAARPTWFSTTPNTFSAPGRWLSETGYGNLQAHYAAAPFVLMPDEALVIEGALPQCRFANLVLWNRYMQTLDSAHRQVSLNRAQMHFGNDGRYRIVLAHRDPGLPNWLDTEGRASGLMYWRFLLASTAVPTPEARVVKFADLA